MSQSGKTALVLAIREEQWRRGSCGGVASSIGGGDEMRDEK